jgi:hypothetical protein
MPFDPVATAQTWPACSEAAVAEIVACADAPLRNLGITQSYHQLTRAVGLRMGTRDLPWTGFAVWASKIAGTFIRRDWMPTELHALVSRHAGPATPIYAEVDRRLREHVARGNCMVYAEVGPLFLDLIAILDTPVRGRPARLRAALERLRPGPVERGGQEPLRRALRAYVEAASCTDDRRRAQLVLLANLLIGYHEQWRLQPEIEGSLDAAWSVLPRPRTPWQRALQRRLAAAARRVLTQFMQIRTPTSTLHLGRDVPPLTGGVMFPHALDRVTLPELRGLLDGFDRTPDSIHGSAADDWGSLDDRMNYLVDLFRTRQRDPELWGPPFSRAQVRAMARGELPDGRL